MLGGEVVVAVTVASTAAAAPRLVLRCSICRDMKPPEAFGVVRRNRGRECRSYLCKTCESEYSRQWRRRHRTHVHVALFSWRCARCREYHRPGETRTTERTKRGGSFYLCARCATAARYVLTLLRWLRGVEAARLPADAEPWTQGDTPTWGDFFALNAPAPRVSHVLRALRALAVGVVADAIETALGHDDTHIHTTVCAKCEARDEARRWLGGEDQGGITINACFAALAIDVEHLETLVGPPCATCATLCVSAKDEKPRRADIREWVPRHHVREVRLAEPPRILVATAGGPMWLPSGVYPVHPDTLAGQMLVVSRRRRGRPRPSQP